MVSLYQCELALRHRLHGQCDILFLFQFFKAVNWYVLEKKFFFFHINHFFVRFQIAVLCIVQVEVDSLARQDILSKPNRYAKEWSTTKSDHMRNAKSCLVYAMASVSNTLTTNRIDGEEGITNKWKIKTWTITSNWTNTDTKKISLGFFSFHIYVNPRRCV